MIAQLRTGAKGLAALGKTEKAYLDNTNLLYVLSDGSLDIGTVRETFFLNQMRVNQEVTASWSRMTLNMATGTWYRCGSLD